MKVDVAKHLQHLLLLLSFQMTVLLGSCSTKKVKASVEIVSQLPLSNIKILTAFIQEKKTNMGFF